MVSHSASLFSTQADVLQNGAHDVWYGSDGRIMRSLIHVSWEPILIRFV